MNNLNSFNNQDVSILVPDLTPEEMKAIIYLACRKEASMPTLFRYVVYDKIEEMLYTHKWDYSLNQLIENCDREDLTFSKDIYILNHLKTNVNLEESIEKLSTLEEQITPSNIFAIQPLRKTLMYIYSREYLGNNCIKNLFYYKLMEIMDSMKSCSFFNSYQYKFNKMYFRCLLDYSNKDVINVGLLDYNLSRFKAILENTGDRDLSICVCLYEDILANRLNGISKSDASRINSCITDLHAHKDSLDKIDFDYINKIT